MSKLHTLLTGLLIAVAVTVPTSAFAYYNSNSYYDAPSYYSPYNTQYDYSRYPASYQQQFQQSYDGSYCGYYDGYYRCPTQSDYERSYHYNTPAYQPESSVYDALPDYYQNYLTPPPVYIRHSTRSTPAPKYYPPSRTVTIYNNDLHPRAISVKRGTMVTWESAERGGSHAIKGDDFDFVSTSFDENGAASYSFTNVGTFHYHCILHPYEIGTITVTE